MSIIFHFTILIFQYLLGYGVHSAKGFSAKSFQRKRNSEKNLSERIFELRVRVQSEGEGEMYFRYCTFRAFFFAENVVRLNAFRWMDTISILI